jgi:diguanylate cyclase (GGDEF)-like protein/PAS domain S-box-containing protein
METNKGLFAVGSDSSLFNELQDLVKRKGRVSDSEIQILAHELRIHQIELELQNRELQEAQTRLELSRDYYSDLYDFAPVGYCTLNPAGKIIDINLQGARLFQRKRDDLINNYLANFLQRQDRVLLTRHLAKIIDQGPTQTMEIVLSVAGNDRYIRIESVSTVSPNGDVFYLSAMIDITVSKQVESDLRLAANVFEKTIDGVMITDTRSRIIAVNPAFTRTTGYSAGEAVGQPAALLKSGQHDAVFYQGMWQRIEETGQWAGEIWNRRKNGELYCESLNICAVRDKQGVLQNYIGIFVDVTKQLQQQQHLEYIAHFDHLTGLANRTLLRDRLLKDIAQANRRKRKLALAFLDLDEFKEVNDGYGHPVGDRLLQVLAKRMYSVMREGDTMARIGGDEFVAIFTDLPDNTACLFGINRLLEESMKSVHLDGRELQVSASIGVTFYPQSEPVDGDQLMRQADQAMYQAKLAGKNRFAYFDQTQDQTIRGYNKLILELEQALASNQFVLYYQPKVNMRSGEILGLEALIRWCHPKKGLLAPLSFLPVIEDHPLAIAIGNWVIDTALSQIEAWLSEGKSLSVSVNIGARQLQQNEFFEQLQSHLANHPSAQPRLLELEILENSALDDIKRISDILRQCTALGVSVGLDDFGTGYSSLTYLKKLPTDHLKIDQSFVRDIFQDPTNLAIIQGVMSLARSFDLRLIAEGVESIEHGELLLQLGCEQAQGYGIARPMPAEQVVAWLETWRPPARWQEQSPVSPSGLPFLTAGIEHRIWHQHLDDYLQGRRGDKPVLDPAQCRLGQWINREGLARLSDNTQVKTLLRMHRKLHELAGKLAECTAAGNSPCSATHTDELRRSWMQFQKQIALCARIT